MVAFGFACGLPLPLAGGFTLRQWMAEGGISLASIGAAATIGLPYALKFLWAPALDRAPPPGFRRFGRRRGWLLLIQPLLALAGAALAFSDPATAPLAVALIATALAVLSASQDAAVDAWRIETFPTRAQGTALAAYVWGYRVALLASGAWALRLASLTDWRFALLAAAALMGAGALVTLAAREPRVERPAEAGGGFAAQLRGAVVEPLRDFLSRPHAGTVLAFVALFKLGEVLSHGMDAPFYRAMGFDRVQVSVATGEPALAATLLGAAAGGWLVARLGVGRALVLAGFGQAATQFLYFALAVSQGDSRVLLAKVVTESFVESAATACFLAYLSGLCSTRFTATQYALLSSVAALGLRTVGGFSGVLAEAMGWVPFYAMTVFASLPAMLIMVRLLRRVGVEPAPR